MAGIDVSYDERGPHLTIWFDHPGKTHRSESKGDDLILKKDIKGRVIGIERRHYFSDRPKESSAQPIPVPIPPAST